MLELLRTAIKEDKLTDLNSLLAQLKLKIESLQTYCNDDFFSTLFKYADLQQNHQALATLMQFLLLNSDSLNINIDDLQNKQLLFIKNPGLKNTIFEAVFKNIIHELDEAALIKFFCSIGNFNKYFFYKFASAANYHQLLAKVRTFGSAKAAFLKRLLEDTAEGGDIQHLDLIIKEVEPENLIAVMIPGEYSPSNYLYLTALLNKGHIAMVKKYLATALSLKAQNEIFYERLVEACFRAAAWEVSVELLSYIVDSTEPQLLYRIIEKNKRYLAMMECVKDPLQFMNSSRSFLMFYQELFKIIGLKNQSLYFSCLAAVFAQSLGVSEFHGVRNRQANKFIMAYETILPEVLQASEADKNSKIGGGFSNLFIGTKQQYRSLKDLY